MRIFYFRSRNCKLSTSRFLARLSATTRSFRSGCGACSRRYSAGWSREKGHTADFTDVPIIRNASSRIVAEVLFFHFGT